MFKLRHLKKSELPNIMSTYGLNFPKLSVMPDRKADKKADKKNDEKETDSQRENIKIIKTISGVSKKDTKKDTIKKEKRDKKDIMVIDNTFSYEDLNGTTHNMNIHMIDIVRNEILPEKIGVRCYYDHHTFSSKPIGIPIEYVPHKKIHSYKTQLNPERVQILKPIYEYKESDENKIIKGDKYFTFGIFCGFKCALAFIEENISNPKYKDIFSDSIQLLHVMRLDMTGKKTKITRALDYLLLDTYTSDGMNIDDWRNNGKHDIKDTEQVIKSVTQLPVGKLYEISIRF